MSEGSVVSIHIAPSGAEAVVELKEVRAVPAKGLEGDRYFNAVGTFSDRGGSGRDVTLVEAEALEALEREFGVKLGPGESRRNVMTRGISLNDLVDRDFTVGGATLRGVRWCEPCAHLAALTHETVIKGLVHRGGLRADIISGGVIRAGDPVTPL